MDRFGWDNLPVCLISPLPVSASLPNGNRSAANLYASGSSLTITTEKDEQSLELAFGSVAAAKQSVTAVTHQLM